MKIGKSLKRQIESAIYEKVFAYLCQLDELDRSYQISHKAWQLTHEPACGLTPDITAAVLRTIEKY